MCLFIKFYYEGIKTQVFVKIDKLKLWIKNVIPVWVGLHRGWWGAVTNRLLLTVAKDCSAPRGRNKNKYYREHISRSLLELNSAKHLFIQTPGFPYSQKYTTLFTHHGSSQNTFFFLLIHNQAVHVQIFFGELISNSKSNFWFPLFNFCNYIVNDFSIWFNEKDLKT